MYIWYYLQFFNLKYIFFYQSENVLHLGENTSKYCSLIIVVHVHATGSQCVTIFQTVSDQEVTLKY